MSGVTRARRAIKLKRITGERGLMLMKNREPRVAGVEVCSGRAGAVIGIENVDKDDVRRSRDRYF